MKLYMEKFMQIRKVVAKLTLLFAIVVITPPLLSFRAEAQTVTVSGVVVDDQGEPLIGATIQAKENKGKGTTTNIDGAFTIVLPTSAKYLIVSYVGMEPQTVKVQGGKKLHIRLESKTNLSEVVVTGIIDKKKESFTGASSTFTGKDLQT